MCRRFSNGTRMFSFLFMKMIYLFNGECTECIAIRIFSWGKWTKKNRCKVNALKPHQPWIWILKKTAHFFKWLLLTLFLFSHHTSWIFQSTMTVVYFSRVKKKQTHGAMDSKSLGMCHICFQWKKNPLKDRWKKNNFLSP